MATLYLTVQGTAVVASGKRRWVDPHWFRGQSYLKLGWNWVKAALTKGWQLFQPASLISHVDPVPAMASRKQREQNRYRLEFTARMINYAR